jgi:diguanylate cyclase (GGDEF)-like protein
MLAVMTCLFLAGGIQLFRLWLMEREHTGILMWSASLLVRAPAFGLLAARETLQDLWVLHIGHSLLYLGVGIGYAATRRFSGRSTSLLVVLAPIGIWNCLSIVPGFVENSCLRLICLSAIMVLYSAATAFEFHRADMLSRPVQLLFTVLFAGASLTHGWRMALIISSPETAEYFTSLGTNGSFIQFLIAIVLTSVAILSSCMLFRDGKLRDLRREAEEDFLTGLMNRNTFRHSAQRAIDEAKLAGKPVCMILFDLDHFKSINDRFGHAAGDSVLQTFSQLMRDRLGTSGITGRIGGEEFACLLTGEAVLRAADLAEGLRLQTRVMAMLGGEPDLRVTVSAGVCAMQATAGFDDLFQRADWALYAAKRRGRDCVEADTSQDFGARLASGGHPSAAAGTDGAEDLFQAVPS